MKRILTLAFCLLALAGCHWNVEHCWHDKWGDYHCTSDHHQTTVVHTSANNGGGYNNNIIVVEESPSYCQWEQPYYHEPEWCVLDYDSTCCMWMGVGAEETYCYYDYCGWELIEVYSYY